MAVLNIAQMHQGVRLAVQQVDANFMDGLLPEEIDFYLNEVIQELVKDFFEGFTRDGRAFEMSQRRIDDLKAILVKDVSLTATYVGSPLNGFHIDRVELPEDHMFTISHRSDLEYVRYGTLDWSGSAGQTRTSTNGKPYKVVNRTAQSDDIYRLLKDPFNTTKFDDPIADINQNYINIYTDERFIIKACILNYLRYPATVVLDLETPANSVDCDLPGHIHNEIVRAAARLLTEHLQQMQASRQQ
jgi:hypothetical protein